MSNHIRQLIAVSKNKKNFARAISEIKCTLVMGFKAIAHNFQQLKKFFILKVEK